MDKKNSHPIHGKRTAELKHTLTGVESLAIHLNDDIFLSTDGDLLLSCLSKTISDGLEKLIGKSLAAYNRAFHWSHGDVDELVLVRPLPSMASGRRACCKVVLEWNLSGLRGQDELNEGLDEGAV